MRVLSGLPEPVKFFQRFFEKNAFNKKMHISCLISSQIGISIPLQMFSKPQKKSKTPCFSSAISIARSNS